MMLVIKPLRCLLVLLSILIFPIANTHAQVNFTFTDKNLKSCDDFATQVLNDPWDMSNSGDINKYFKDVDIQNFTTPQFTGGQFQGTTASAASYFYLFSPAPAGAYAVGGRWGQTIGFNSSKFTQFSIKYSATKPDEEGLRMIWDRALNYASNRNIVRTRLNKFQTGPRTYSIDLTSFDGSDFQGDSSNTAHWEAEAVTGLAIIPTTKIGSAIGIDWIRLEDPTSCTIPGPTGTGEPLSYTAVPVGNDNLMNVYLVPEGVTNPVQSGYVKKIVSKQPAADGSVSITDTVGLPPGTYKAVALLDGDFATIERDNPWDFNDDADVASSFSISNLNYASGVLSGTSSGGIFNLQVDSGINLSTYKFVTIKGSFSSAPSVIGPSPSNTYHQLTRHESSEYYSLDLTGTPSWSGTSGNFRIYIPSGSFTIDFVSARKNGTDINFNRSAASVAAKMSTPSGSVVVINAPPSIDIKTPNEQGGEALRPWNMNSGDFNVFANLLEANDSNYPAESTVSYLPDVRALDGVRGDFFKGTSKNGSDDPINYSTAPFGSFNKFSFSSSEYRNLCFRLLIDRDFSLGTGSVGRAIYEANGIYYTSEDIPLIYDGWSGSRWYNYCMEMSAVPTDGSATSNWNGTISAFRIDPHEFNVQTSYYFDWIKLRKDYLAPGVLSVAYDTSDADNDPITLTFYASTTKNTLGTAIPGASFVVGTGSRVYQLNTTNLTNGSYYINVQASDGVNNTVTRYGTGRVTVSNSASQGSAPVLSLEAPVVNATYCDALQLKGYALQTDRFENVAAVEVSIDGTWLTNIYPNLYSGLARATYPTADASNSGFNELVDISSISNGSHTATITAHSTRGLTTTLSRTFTKSNTGCTTPLTDPNPSGTPIAVSLNPTTTPRPTATPIPNPVKVAAAVHSKAGAATIILKPIPGNYRNCSLNLYIRRTAGSARSKVVSAKIDVPQVVRKEMKLTLKGMTVSSKGPQSIILSNNVTCGSRTNTESPVRTLKLSRGARGLTTYGQIISAMKRLKAVP
jgi:hypothetical protein